MGGRELKLHGDETVLLEDEWLRSYRVTNQHPDLPWNLMTHGFLDPIHVSCDPADQLQASLGGFGPECPGSVPESVPENGGVRRSVPRGVAGAFRAPGSGVSKCPESVPRVSGTPF